MLPPNARSPTRGNGDRAPAKVGFGKRDKLPEGVRLARAREAAA
jgi:hypothetical protein